MPVARKRARRHVDEGAPVHNIPLRLEEEHLDGPEAEGVPHKELLSKDSAKSPGRMRECASELTLKDWDCASESCV